jgi:hypothetical protein
VPTAIVSSAISALFLLGKVTAMEERICLTPPYGKSIGVAQMH